MLPFCLRGKDMNTNKPSLCFIKESYFINHSAYINMLDTGDVNKQSKRTHLCLAIENNTNMFYIPLRNNLGNEIRKFGRIGHSVPSKTRINAGLDFRYALIINDASFIEEQLQIKIPNSQYRKIVSDFESKKNEFNTYLNGFIRAAKKGRIQVEPLYRVSSLINFIPELNI